MARRRRPEMTSIDYVVIALSPALIMALVGSLCFFLVEIGYHGEHGGRLNWIMFWFVFAIVLIARISIEEGKEKALFYGLALSGAVALVVLRLLDSVGVALGLLAVVWWCANKLTWDCTVIDDEQDASGEGLLQVAGLDRGDASRAADPNQAAEPANDAEDGTGRKRRRQVTWWQQWLGAVEAEENEKKPHAPGVWVVYFSLAALPLFGLGQSMVPAGEMARRRYVFLLLLCYVAAGLGLLLTTSFLGLRRYLRQRKLEMPLPMTGIWLGVGAVLITALLLAGVILPRPIAEYPVEELIANVIGSPKRRASDYAVLTEGHGEGEGRPSSDTTSQASDEQGGNQQGGGQQGGGKQSGGQQSGSRPNGNQQGEQQGGNQQGGGQQGGGKQSGGQQSGSQPRGNQQGEQQGGNQKAGGQQGGGKQSGGQQSGASASGGRQPSGESGAQEPNKQQGGNQQGGGQQGGGKQSGGQQSGSQSSGSQQGEQQGSNQSGEQQAGDQQANKPASSGEQTNPNKDPNRTDQQPAGGAASSPPAGEGPRPGQETKPPQAGAPGQRAPKSSASSPPQPPKSPPAAPKLPRLNWSLADWIRWLMYGTMLAAAIYGFIRYREQVLAFLRQMLEELKRIWSDLFGRKRPVETDAGAEESRPVPRPFAAFADPFANGAAARSTPDELVRYTFAALEAWAFERGAARRPEATPHEFAQQLGSRTAELAADVQSLANHYAQITYARGSLTHECLPSLKRLWQRLRIPESAVL